MPSRRSSSGTHWSIAKCNHDYGDPVFIEDKPEYRFLIDIARKFEEAGLDIVARDITSDIGIPAVAAFSRDLSHGDTLPIEGFGATRTRKWQWEGLSWRWRPHARSIS